jgi:multidrug resistance protein, MATE family
VTGPAAPPPDTTQTSQSTLRALVKLALPLAVVQVGASSLGIIDTAVVGRTTAQELAAVGLGNSIAFATSIIGMGLVLGVEPLVAQAVGAGDSSRARQWFRQGVLVALLAWPLVVALVALFLLALPLFGVDADVVPLVNRYVIARSFGLLPFLLYWAVKAYLQALGRTRAPVIGVVLAMIVEALLDIALVFGVPTLGIPALGVVGAGIAHTVTSCVRLLVVAIAVRADSTAQDNAGRLARLRAAFVVEDLRRIVKVGLPLGLQLALEVGVFAFAALTMGRLGAHDLAAHQVALQCASVTFNVMVGLGSASAVVVGRRIGAGDRAGTQRAGVMALWLSIGFMTLTGAMFLVGGEAIARLLTTDERVVQGAAQLLMIAAAFQLSDGLQTVASGALRGAGDTRASFLIHLVSHWGIGMPAVVALVALGFGGAGVWWGLTLGLTVAAALLVMRWVRGARRGFQAL